MIRFKCSSCQTGLKAPAEYEGKKVKCSSCSEVIRIPRMQIPGDQQVQKDIFCICGHCKANFKVKYSSVEKKIKCPTCAGGVLVPGVQSRFSETSNRFVCGGCSMHYCVPSRYAGKKFPCLDCKHPVTVPVKSLQKAPPAPAPEPKPDPQFEMEPQTDFQQDMDFENDFSTPGMEDGLDAPASNWADQLDQEMAINAQRKEAQKELDDQRLKESMSTDRPGQVTLSDGRIIRTKGHKTGKKSSELKGKLVKILVNLVIIAGLAVGFFMFSNLKPKDGSQDAISYSRSMIFRFNKGDYGNVNNIYDVIELVEEGIKKPETIIGDFPGGKPSKITPELLYSKLDHHASGYVVRSTVVYEDEDYTMTQTVDMVISEYDGEFNYLKVVVKDEEGTISIFAEEPAKEVSQQELKSIVDDYVLANAGMPNAQLIYLVAAGLVAVFILTISFRSVV